MIGGMILGAGGVAALLLTRDSAKKNRKLLDDIEKREKDREADQKQDRRK